MHAWIRNWREALAGRRGITVPGTCLAIVIVYLTTVPFEIPRLYLDRADHPLLSTLVEASIGSLAVLAGGIAVRFASDRFRFWIVLVSYLGFGVIRAIAFVREPWADSDTDNMVGQLVVSCLLALIALSIPAIAWDQLDRYRTSSRQLSADTYLLNQRSTRLEQVHRDVSRSLQSGIDDQIRPALRRFSTMISSQSESLRRASTEDLAVQQAALSRVGELSAEMREYSQTYVRGFSHDVVDSLEDRNDDIEAISRRRVPVEVTEVFTSTRPTLTRSRPFAPLVFVLLAAFFISVAAVGAFGWVRGISGALLGCGSATLVLVIADRRLTTRLRRGRLRPEIYWIIGVYVVAALFAAILPLPFYEPSVDRKYWLIWAVVAFVSVMVFCLLSGGLGTVGYLTALQSDLRARSSTLQWAIEREQVELHQIGVKVADTLHTRVQGRMVAAAANLNLVAEQNRAAALPSGELADSILRSALDLANTAAGLSAADLLSMDQSEHTPGVWAGVTAVVSAWRGVLDIDASCSQPDLDVIDRQPAAADLVVWIVQELASNSFRHGQANRLAVAVSVSDDHIEVSGTDDGIGLGPQWESGLGLTGLARAGVRIDLHPLPGKGVQAVAVFQDHAISKPVR